MFLSEIKQIFTVNIKAQNIVQTTLSKVQNNLTTRKKSVLLCVSADANPTKHKKYLVCITALCTLKCPNDYHSIIWFLRLHCCIILQYKVHELKIITRAY